MLTSTPALTIEVINPAIAQRYLDTTKSICPINPGLVLDFALKMRKGKWDDLSRYIEFTVEGDLIGGHHRLHAIVCSGKAQRFGVVRGLPVSVRPSKQVPTALVR